MTDKVNAKRYAEAFLLSCEKKQGKALAVEELKLIKNAVLSNIELKAFLGSVEINHDEKLAFLDAAFGKTVRHETVQFLKFLCERKHIQDLVMIADCAEALYSAGQKSEGVIRTTVRLENTVVDTIRAYLEKKLQKEINFKIEIDPGLVSGIQVIVDNLIIDGSVRRRLEELRAKLLSIKVV